MSKEYRKIDNDVYLTGKDIEKMNDEELVGVNRIAINLGIIKLEKQRNSDDEAIEILMKASREIREKEKKLHGVALWGVKMTVKDVKRAFGNLDGVLRTSFKKIIE